MVLSARFQRASLANEPPPLVRRNYEQITLSDAMVDEFSVAGTPADVREKIRRFDGVVDEVVLTVPSFQISEERVAENLALLTEHCAPGA